MKIYPWLQNLPKHWRVARLGHIAKISAGSADVQDSVSEVEFPFIVRSSHIQRLSYYTHDTEAVLTADDGNVGDIFHYQNGKFAAHQRVYVIESGPLLDGKYLFYVMQRSFKDSLMGATAKSTVESLRRPTLTSSQVPLPLFEEQKKIELGLGYKLAEIDGIIATQQKALALLSESFEAAIQEKLQQHIGSVVPLKHLGILRSGITLGASYSGATKLYPYFRVAIVQMGHVDTTDRKYTKVPGEVATINILHKGDVLITEGGDRYKPGRGTVWDGRIAPMLHQNHIYSFQGNEKKLLPKFLELFLQAPYARSCFNSTVKKSTNLAINNSTIVKDLETPKVSKNNQKTNQAIKNRFTWNYENR